MADPHLEAQDEKPLDPAAEALRRKMLRLMVVSIGTMFIGIFAVLFAIVYKMNTSGNQAPVQASIDLPDGFAIEETSIGDGKVIFRGVTGAGESTILMFDSKTGEPRGQFDIR